MALESTATLGFIMIGVLFILLALGVHIALALAVVGFVGMVFIVGFEGALLSGGSNIYYRISDYKLVTIPLFVIMGFLAASGGVSGKLYDAASLWLSKLKSGLGIATVAASTGFGAVCGSSLVTASVFARISAPEMRKRGYDKRLAYGICAASGMIGMLIPPSILLVVYGFLSGESIGKLLIGGITPGILLAISYAVGIELIARLKPNWIRTAAPTGITWARRFSSLIPTWPVLVVAAIIFGGIFWGIFSATEAGSVAAFTMLILVVGVRRRDALGHIKEAFFETIGVSAMIFFILAGASMFGRFLVLSGVTNVATDFIVSLNLNDVSLVIMIVLLYLVMGAFLDSISMLSITIPLLNPIILHLGIDPIWYALVIVLAVEIGLLTPPVGLNVYATAAVAEADVTIEDVFAGSTPFFFLALVTLAIMIAFPALITFLPNLVIAQ